MKPSAPAKSSTKRPRRHGRGGKALLYLFSTGSAMKVMKITVDTDAEAGTEDDHVDAETEDGQDEGESRYDRYEAGLRGRVYFTRNFLQVVRRTTYMGHQLVFWLSVGNVEHGRGDHGYGDEQGEYGDHDEQEGENEDYKDDEGDEGDDEYDEDEEGYGGGVDDDDDGDGDGDYPSDSDSDHHQHLYGEGEYVCTLPDCPERLLIILERSKTRRDFFRDAMMIMHDKYAHLLDVSGMGDDAQGYIPTERPWESEDARLKWAEFLNRVPDFVCSDADNNLPCSIDDINDFYALRAWMLELLPWVVESPPLAIRLAP
ncbi:hypothetical protein ASPACDRAFT_47286 [Aspergillus aculeatus ATCC 16872]|uniref:Uncharacterized protein n=1 Tax=Aspergillus aculeatus (strain ATCC 16872 / CBS 172.66 / WB 5094) TaxID=690307 RepID=A0A1L9WIB6_ASPA1|nr:uncharacterized protein ASPACDRAFT_47286 [Aspergillus aculeatus ATCC 16872]OJJ95932.1 hypothetical protein ASPACDRAFT_47286 [Aspergillus aculeatus ATCC 16872]